VTAHLTPRRLVGGTALQLVVRSAGLVMGLVVTVLLARGMPQGSFGTFATGLALAQIGTTFTDFGFSALLVREGSTNPHLRRALLLWATRVRVGFSVVALVVLVGVAFLLVEGRESRVAVVLIIMTVPINALTLGMSLLQQQLLLGRIAGLLFVQSILWLAVVATLSVTGAGVLAYALGFVGCTAVYSMLVHHAARRALHGPSESMTLRAFRTAMRDVAPLSITAVLVMLYYRLDSIFVYEFAGNAAAASYAVAYRFLDQLQIIPATLSIVFLPLLTRRRAAGERTTPTFELYLRVTLLLCTPAVGVGVFVARPLILTVFGTEYADAVVLLRLLLPAFIPVALGYVLSYVAVVHRQARKQLLAAGLALIANVALNVLLVPRYGAAAAALVTLVTETAVVLTLYLTLRRPCELRLPGSWLIRLAACIGAASVVALLVSRADPIAGGAAFAGAFLTAGSVLRLVDRAEIRALLRDRSDRSADGAEPLVDPEHLPTPA